MSPSATLSATTARAGLQPRQEDFGKGRVPTTSGSITLAPPNAVADNQSSSTRRDESPRSWSRADLISGALARLNRQTRRSGGFIKTPVVDALVKVVSLIVRDESPTPQIALDEFGGIEVVWLVDNQLLTLHVDADARPEICAVNRNGREIFSGAALLSDDSVNDLIILKAAQYLTYLSADVRARAWQ